MADYRDLCHTPGSQKWLKCWMAVYITRGGILPFVREQMTDLHKAFLDIIEKEGLHACSSCCIPNVLNCPTRGLCYVKKGHCNLHSAPELMYKFCKAHDRFKTEIEKQNRLKPFWTSSKAEKWFSSPLELAKCFLPKGEYSEKESFDELDFNGLIALIINCKTFETLFQAKMSDQTNICTEVRDLVNKIRHFERIDIPITDVELQDTIDNMIRLLSDPKDLCNREGVLRGLKQLKGDTLVISTQDAIKCLEEAYKSIDETNSKALEYIKKDITEKLEAFKDEVENITDKSLSKVREERGTSIAAIEEQRKQAFADIEKHLKEQDERDQLSKTSFKDQTDSLEAFAHVQEHKLEKIANDIDRETKEARTRSMYPSEEHLHKEFQLELIKYQERKHGYLQPVALVPDIKVPIDSLYVNPDVAIIQDNKDNSHEGHSGNESMKVESFRNMLFKKGEAFRIVHVIGEPGTGKTSFCSKIVSSWCKAQRSVFPQKNKDPIDSYDLDNVTTFLDEDTLSYASDAECDITEIISSQINFLEETYTAAM
ncbi:LOW QUALITY PROTEIN: hypothetical protein MAR_024056 [Mya arenaria]|uniref:DZIP3-like HEPN domain-containing protein n=1 Tax=Mya arenaria TaxID=6604 RepID=A0ABY7DS00_MYAAR|nr:LOW QUALITY PROTEIN: hypothetical protein MAR_024056 [Mya arenaria]